MLGKYFICIAMARRRRKNESLFDVLMSLPWQVSVAIGGAVFVALKWALPAMWASNMYLKAMATTFSSLAWLFSGFFLLMGVVVFFVQKMAEAKVAVSGSKVAFGRSPRREWKPPARASTGLQVRREPIDIGGGTSEHVLLGQRGPLGESVVPSSAWVEPAIDRGEKPTAWSLDLIRTIEWKRFEDLCQQFYEIKGIRSETTPLGPDGGIDIRLYQDDSGKATSVVQCKAWGERFVGVKPVRELLGVMTHEKIEKAFFMTSGRFSEEAKEVAKGNRITLIDGQMLMMMIQRLPAESQRTLLNFAIEGDYTTPTCPSCGIKMKIVPGKTGKPDFWGCRNFPKCRQILGKRRPT
jgi:restriction system protein